MNLGPLNICDIDEECVQRVILLCLWSVAGWDVESDWKDVLSGGEKQRMGMARIFYHKYV